MFCAGVFASSMPTVTGVFTGTKALIRPGKNIFSPVTGWRTASRTRFASHRSASDMPHALPAAAC